MRKRKTIQIISALALFLVLAGFLAACGDPYQPIVDIRRVKFPNTLTLKEGELKALRVTIIKPSVINETLDATWESSNDEVATVEIFGADHNDDRIPVPKTTTVDLLVTAKTLPNNTSEDEATITVTVDPGGRNIYVECTVIVTKSGTTTNPDPGT